jgi:Transposase DDE domain group 1
MWVLTPILPIWSPMPAKVESTPALPGLSPVGGKPVIARFDGGHLSSDGGLLVLREVEQRLDVAGRLAACLTDPRDPDRVVHGLDEIIRFRLLMERSSASSEIAAGYEDGNDADRLRTDPMFKLAMVRLEGETALCSQPTISRLENLPDKRALLRIGQTMVDLYCGSFRQVPRRIVLDVDDTFDAVHGEQQMRLFNAHHDEYGFQPIVVFDGEGRFVTAVLRPAKRPFGREIRAFLCRLVRQLRANWPRIEILLRADSHYCAPEVLSWCRANKVDYLLGVAPTSTLRRHIERLETSTAARFAASDGRAKLRRYTEFYDGAASWEQVERSVEPRGSPDIARVEAGPDGTDTRFIVTSLPSESARTLYERRYCQRGQAENHIKSWKRHLAADRTSCTQATANQFRLFLHAGAYWLMWSLRTLMPRRSSWRTLQFDTLRLRLIKLAVRVVEMKTQVKLHLPSSTPCQSILALVLGRMPRLIS